MTNKEILKMLRKILDDQNAMKSELLRAFGRLDKKLSKLTINLGKGFDAGFGKVNKSLDKLELQITNLRKRRKIAAERRAANREQKIAAL